MNSLDIFSVRALMRALEQIHSTLDLEILPETLFSAVRELVAGAQFSFDQLDLRTGVGISMISRDLVFPEEMKKKIIELMPTHPVVPAYKEGRRGAIRVTDCISQRRFQDTPHCRELLLPVGLRYQTVVTLDVPGKIAGMTVNRDKDFTEKEVRFLQLIAPQIALAHQNAQAFATLRQAAAARTIPAPEDFERIGLTPREGEVLHWVIQGKRDKEVADILSTRPRTIHSHLRSILRKLNTETRTGAALEGFERLKGSSASCGQ
jgi:DNA-binding CsgD family transcriptional regulator